MAVRFNNYEPGAAFASLLNQQEQAYQDRLALGWVPSERDADEGMLGSFWDSAWGAGYSTLGGALNTAGILTGSEGVYDAGNYLNQRAAALTNRNDDYDSGTKSRLSLEYIFDPNGLANEAGTLVGSSLPGLLAGAALASGAPEAAVAGAIGAGVSAVTEMGANFGQGYMDKKRDSIETAMKNGDRSGSVYDSNIDYNAWKDFTKDPAKNVELAASSIMDTALDVAGGATKGLGSAFLNKTGLGKALATNGGKVIESALGDSVRSEALLGRALNLGNKLHAGAIARYAGDRAIDAAGEGFQEAWQQRVQDAMSGKFDDDGTGRDQALSFFSDISKIPTEGLDNFTDDEKNAFMSAALPSVVTGTAYSGARTLRQRLIDSRFKPENDANNDLSRLMMSTAQAPAEDGSMQMTFTPLDSQTDRIDLMNRLADPSVNLDAINTNIRAFNEASDTPAVNELTPDIFEMAKSNSPDAASATHDVLRALAVPENAPILREIIKGRNAGREADATGVKDNIKNIVSALGKPDANVVQEGIASANALIRAVSPTWAASDINKISKGGTYVVNQATMDAARENNPNALRDVLRSLNPAKYNDVARTKAIGNDYYQGKINQAVQAFRDDGNVQHLADINNLNKESVQRGYTDKESARQSMEKVVQELQSIAQERQNRQNASESLSERGVEEAPKEEGVVTTPQNTEVQKQPFNAQFITEPVEQEQVQSPVQEQVQETPVVEQIQAQPEVQTQEEPVSEQVQTPVQEQKQKTPVKEEEEYKTPPKGTQKTPSLKRPPDNLGKAISALSNVDAWKRKHSVSQIALYNVPNVKPKQVEKAIVFLNRLNRFLGSKSFRKKKPEEKIKFYNNILDKINKSNIHEEQKKMFQLSIEELKAEAQPTPTNTQVQQEAEPAPAAPVSKGETNNDGNENKTNQPEQTTESSTDNKAAEGTENRRSESQQGRSTETSPSNKNEETNNDKEQTVVKEEDDEDKKKIAELEKDENNPSRKLKPLDEDTEGTELFDEAEDDDGDLTDEDQNALIDSLEDEINSMASGKGEKELSKGDTEKKAKENASRLKMIDSVNRSLKDEFGVNTTLTDSTIQQCIDGAVAYIHHRYGGSITSKIRQYPLFREALKHFGVDEDVNLMKYLALVGPLARQGFSELHKHATTNASLDEEGNFAKSYLSSSNNAYSVLLPAIHAAILNYSQFRQNAEKIGATPVSLNTFLSYCIRRAISDYKWNSSSGTLIHSKNFTAIKSVSDLLGGKIAETTQEGIIKKIDAKNKASRKKIKPDFKDVFLTKDDIHEILQNPPSELTPYQAYVSSVIGVAAKRLKDSDKNLSTVNSIVLALSNFIANNKDDTTLRVQKEVSDIDTAMQKDRRDNSNTIGERVRKEIMHAANTTMDELKDLAEINPADKMPLFKKYIEDNTPRTPEEMKSRKSAVINVLSAVKRALSAREAIKEKGTKRLLNALQQGMSDTNGAGIVGKNGEKINLSTEYSKSSTTSESKVAQRVDFLHDRAGDLESLQKVARALFYPNAKDVDARDSGASDSGLQEALIEYRNKYGAEEFANIARLFAVWVNTPDSLPDMSRDEINSIRSMFFDKGSQDATITKEVAQSFANSSVLDKRSIASDTDGGSTDSGDKLSVRNVTASNSPDAPRSLYIILNTVFGGQKDSDAMYDSMREFIDGYYRTSMYVNMMAENSFIIGSLLDLRHADTKNGIYTSPMSPINKAYYLQAHLAEYMRTGKEFKYARDKIAKLNNIMPTYRTHVANTAKSGKALRTGINNIIKEMLADKQGRIVLGLAKDPSTGKKFSKFGFINAMMPVERQANSPSTVIASVSNKRFANNSDSRIKLNAKYVNDYTQAEFNSTVKQFEDAIINGKMSTWEKNMRLIRLRGAIMNLNRRIDNLARMATKEWKPDDPLVMFRAVQGAKREVTTLDVFNFSTYAAKEVTRILKEQLKHKQTKVDKHLEPGLRIVAVDPGFVYGIANAEGRKISKKIDINADNVIEFRGNRYWLEQDELEKYYSFEVINKDGSVNDKALEARDKFCESVCADSTNKTNNHKANRIVKQPLTTQFSDKSSTKTMQAKDRYAYKYITGTKKVEGSDNEYRFNSPDGLSSYINTMYSVFFDPVVFPEERGRERAGSLYVNNVLAAIVAENALKTGKVNDNIIEAVRRKTDDFTNTEVLLKMVNNAAKQIQRYMDTRMLTIAQTIKNKEKSQVEKEAFKNQGIKNIQDETSTKQSQFVNEKSGGIVNRIYQNKIITSKRELQKQSAKQVVEQVDKAIKKEKEADRLLQQEKASNDLFLAMMNASSQPNPITDESEMILDEHDKIGKMYKSGKITKDTYDKKVGELVRRAMVVSKDALRNLRRSKNEADRVANFNTAESALMDVSSSKLLSENQMKMLDAELSDSNKRKQQELKYAKKSSMSRATDADIAPVRLNTITLDKNNLNTDGELSQVLQVPAEKLTTNLISRNFKSFVPSIDGVIDSLLTAFSGQDAVGNYKLSPVANGVDMIDMFSVKGDAKHPSNFTEAKNNQLQTIVSETNTPRENAELGNPFFNFFVGCFYGLDKDITEGIMKRPWIKEIDKTKYSYAIDLHDVDVSKIKGKEKNELLWAISRSALNNEVLTIDEVNALKKLLKGTYGELKDRYGFDVAKQVVLLGALNREQKTGISSLKDASSRVMAGTERTQEEVADLLKKPLAQPFFYMGDKPTKALKIKLSEAQDIISRRISASNDTTVSFLNSVAQKIKSKYQLHANKSTTAILATELVDKFMDKLGDSVSFNIRAQEIGAQGAAGSFQVPGRDNEFKAKIYSNTHVETISHELSHAINTALMVQDLETGKIKGKTSDSGTHLTMAKDKSASDADNVANLLMKEIKAAKEVAGNKANSASKLMQSVFDMMPEGFGGENHMKELAYNMLDSGVATANEDSVSINLQSGAARRLERFQTSDRQVGFTIAPIALIEASHQLSQGYITGSTQTALEESYNYILNTAVKEDRDNIVQAWYANTISMLKDVNPKQQLYSIGVSFTAYSKSDLRQAVQVKKAERKPKTKMPGNTGRMVSNDLRLYNAKPDGERAQKFQKFVNKITRGKYGDKAATQTARLKKSPLRWFGKSWQAAIEQLEYIGVDKEQRKELNVLTQRCLSNQQRFHEQDEIKLNKLNNLLHIKDNTKSSLRIREEAFRIVNQNSDRGRDIVEHITINDGKAIKLYAGDIFLVMKGFDSVENAKAGMREAMQEKIKKAKSKGGAPDIDPSKIYIEYNDVTGTVIGYCPTSKSLNKDGSYKNIKNIYFDPRKSSWKKEEAKLMNSDKEESEKLLRRGLEKDARKFNKEEIDRIVAFWKMHRQLMEEAYSREKIRELLADDIINRKEVGYLHAYSPRIYSQYVLIKRTCSAVDPSELPEGWEEEKDKMSGNYRYRRLADDRIYETFYEGVGSFESQKERWEYRQGHPLVDPNSMYIEAKREDYLNMHGGRNDVVSVNDGDSRTITDEDVERARQNISRHATGKLANLIRRKVDPEEAFTVSKMKKLINKWLDQELETDEGYNEQDVKAMRDVLNGIVESEGLRQIENFGEFADKIEDEGAQYLSAGYAKERNSQSNLYNHDVIQSLSSYMFSTANVAALTPIHKELTKIIKQATGQNFSRTRRSSEESIYNLGCEVIDTIEGRDTPIDKFLRKASSASASFLNQMPIFKQIADATGVYMPDLWMQNIMNRGMYMASMLLLGCFNLTTAFSQYSQLNNVRVYVGEKNFLRAMNESKKAIAQLNTTGVFSGKFDTTGYPPEVKQALINGYLISGDDSNTIEMAQEFERRLKAGDKKAKDIDDYMKALGVQLKSEETSGQNGLTEQLSNAGSQYQGTKFSATNNPVDRARITVRKMFMYGMGFFRAADISCRVVAAFAAYHMAEQDASFQLSLQDKTPEERKRLTTIYIEDVINKTNFNFNRATDPILLHNAGQLGRAVFQFGKFGLLNIGYMQMLLREKGTAALGNYILSTMLISGVVSGIPCMTAVGGVSQAIFGFNPEDWMKQFIMRAVSDYNLPKPVAETMCYGILAPALGIDISKKVGLSDLVRDPTDTKNLFGPVFGKLGELAEGLHAGYKMLTDDTYDDNQAMFAFLRTVPMAAKWFQALRGQYYSYNKFTPKTEPGSMSTADRIKLMLGATPIENRMDTDVNRYIIDANQRYSDEVRSAMMKYYNNPSAKNEQLLKEYGKTGKDAQRMVDKLIKKKLTAEAAEEMTNKSKSERAQEVRANARKLGVFLDM